MTLDEYTIEDGGSTNLAGEICSIHCELDGMAVAVRRLIEEDNNV